MTELKLESSNHELLTMVHCKRADITTPWTPNSETPYCPYCGERILPKPETRVTNG